MIDTADIMGFIHRRSGTVAAASAVVGLTLGSLCAYQVTHTPPAARILLRQATEGDPMDTFNGTPGANGFLILLRNDGTTPVEVLDAAFSRTSAAPPLYIAPETVAPGAEVNVEVPVPQPCNDAYYQRGVIYQGGVTYTLTDGPAPPPIQIMVGARLLGGPTESVPVEVVGQLAAIMDACHGKGGS